MLKNRLTARRLYLIILGIEVGKKSQAHINIIRNRHRNPLHKKIPGIRRLGAWKRNGGMVMKGKEKMKGIIKATAVAVTAMSLLIASVAPMNVQAKGTGFINKKVASVTPTIKSAKRSGNNIKVTVSVPKNKVKKLGKVKKITVSYGSTKNSKKYEDKRTQVKVTKKGSNQYTFTIKNKKLASYKNAYISVRFGKTNWSKLTKVSGKATKSNARYMICCNHCDWYYEYGSTQAEVNKAFAAFSKHQDDLVNAYKAKCAPRVPGPIEMLKAGVCHDGFTIYSTSISVTYE